MWWHVFLLDLPCVRRSRVVCEAAQGQSDEMELLESTECFRGGESRLACQVKVTDDIEGMHLTVAPEE